MLNNNTRLITMTIIIQDIIIIINFQTFVVFFFRILQIQLIQLQTTNIWF